MNNEEIHASGPRLERLLGFLKSDPDNIRLLADAASAAFEAGQLDLAHKLVERHRSIALLPSTLANLEGLIAIRSNEFARAAEIFESLRKDHDDPGLRCNLAWAKALMGRYQEACDLLDDEAIASSPRAPSLKIHLMHHLDLYEEALALGETLVQQYPTDRALMGALATLALDAERIDLATRYAGLAGNDPEGAAVRGYLALGEHDTASSLAMFDAAIAAQPNNPRAWVGKGLGLLISGDAAAGAQAVDRGAELFKDHIGSWVVSGWAHFVTGEYDKARASFERALAIDDRFAESQGGLAVIDIMEGNTKDAEHRCEVALRLDRNCFGAALAKSLLLDKAGQEQSARRVREIALSRPVGPKGETLAQAIASFGYARRPSVTAKLR